jgi:hypothetical protein
MNEEINEFTGDPVDTHGKSCVNIVTVKIGDDPKDTKKVNDIMLHFLKLKVPQMTGGHNIIRYFVYTDYPEDPELDTDLGIIPIPLEIKDGITNPDYYKLDMFDNKIENDIGKVLDDKCIIWDIDLMPLNACQMQIIDSLPYPGEVDDTFLEGDIDTDLIKEIKKNKYISIRMSSNWHNQDKAFNPWYIEFCNWDSRNLAQDKEKLIEDPNDFDLCQYILDNHKGLVLASPPGLFSPFYADNREMNEELEPIWESEVKKFFPEQWQGEGGDPLDDLYYYDHEWKHINAQTKFIYIDEGPKEETLNRYNDLFLRLWVF